MNDSQPKDLPPKRSHASVLGPVILLIFLAASVALTPSAQQPLAAAERPEVVETLAAASTVMDDEPIPQIVTAPLPSPAAPVVVDHTPRVGSRGEQILAIEQKLSGMGYLVGKVDGVFDRATQHGVIAFQKVEGLTRNGRGDGPTLTRLASASTPSPKYASPSDHLEVDIARQVVFVVRGGRVTAILPTSTGSNKNFTNQGWTRRAITPNGVFKISRKINGMRISPLGELYKPSYFNGGIAFHGNGAVPIYPASHGCVRLPMPFADWFFANASPIGMMVYVHGGPTGANPQPVIDDKPAKSPSPSPSPSSTGSPTPDPTGTPVTDTVT